MSKLFILVRYDYLLPKDRLEIMGFFESREDVNKWKKDITFKAEYKMKTIEFNIDKHDLDELREKGIIGLTENFKFLYDVL